MRHLIPTHTIAKNTLSSLAILLATTHLSHALPSGGQVVSGDVTISGSPTGELLVEQFSGKAIVDWQSFNASQGEITNIVQQSATDIMLNRVTGGPSVYDGQLNANGQVWFVNTNGFTWGPNAQVNVGGLLTSAADINNSDFLDGNYAFNIPGLTGAQIINQGTIVASNGGVVMAGFDVQNHGTITANLGSIVLGAASNYTVDFDGDGLISFDTGIPVQQGGDLINTGALQANGGQVLMKASLANQLLDKAIQVGGTITAQSVNDKKGNVTVESNGDIYIDGQVDVTGNDAGESGGNINFLGRIIDMASGLLDASGEAGGGNVTLVTQEDGDNSVAKTVRLNEASTINVSAIDNGDGGNIRVIGLHENHLNGTLLGTGGANGGNGGMVTVVPKAEYAPLIEYHGMADLSAVGGENGSVNLHVRRLSIINGAYDSGNGYAQLSLQNTLDNNTNVNIIDEYSIPGIELGNITWSGDGNLSIATNELKHNYAQAVSLGSGDLTINTNRFESYGGLLETNSGDINLTVDNFFGKYISNDTAYGIRSNTGDITLNIGWNMGIFSDPNNGVTGNVISSNHGKVTANLGNFENSAAPESPRNLSYLVGALGNGSAEKGTEVVLHGDLYYGPLNINYDNITIRSLNGRDNTNYEGVIAISGDYVTIDGLTIKRSQFAEEGSLQGIFVNDAQYGGIYNSRLLNGLQELRLTNTNGFTVKGNEFTGLHGAAIGVSGSSNFGIYENNIDGAATGIFVTDSQMGFIDDNDFKNFTETGIRLQSNVSDINVFRNHIEGGAIGVADVFGSNNVFASNVINNSILYGAYVEGTTNTELKRSYIQFAQSAGVAGFDTQDMKIIDNDIHNSNTGIQMRTGVNTLIQDNDLSNLTNSGISLYNDSHGSIIQGNFVSGVQSGTSILAHNSDDILIDGNDISNSMGTEGVDGAGVSVLNAETATITNNVFDDIFGFSLEVFNSGDIIVGNNSYDDGDDVFIQANSVTEIGGGAPGSAATGEGSGNNLLLAMADQPSGEPTEAPSGEPTEPTEEPTWPGQFLEGEEEPEWELLPPPPGPSEEPVEEEPADGGVEVYEPTVDPGEFEGSEPTMVDPYGNGFFQDGDGVWWPQDYYWMDAEGVVRPINHPESGNEPAQEQYLIGYDLQGNPIYSNEPGWPEPEYPTPTLIPTEPTDGSPTLIPNSPPFNEDPATEGVVY